jgi:hypothetical protein
LAERREKLYADALSIFIKIREEKRVYSTRIEWPTAEVMLEDIKKGNEERKTEKTKEVVYLAPALLAGSNLRRPMYS